MENKGLKIEADGIKIEKGRACMFVYVIEREGE